MRNLKHTIIAIAAFVMVGTLSYAQISETAEKKQERDMKISTANSAQSITISKGETGTIAVAMTNTDEDVKAAEAAQAESSASYADQEVAEKSYLTLGYAKVTGSVEIKSEPNEEAQATGKMSGADQVEILESTDGWYKVLDDGQVGYVQSDQITLDKGQAQESALQYDHYKKANVTAENGLVVRSSNSSEASSVGTVNDGDNLIVVDAKGDYVKVLYGDEYTEGYVINTGIETTGEWVEKDDVHTQIKRIAAEKAEEARREEIARQNAARASASYSTANGSNAAQAAVSSNDTAVQSAPALSSGSGKGQAIVNTAMKYLGTPYTWGGTSPSGFDCSGLVQYSCRANGISVPRVAASQRGAGRYVSRENLQPGDLVFFSNGGGISHVGIYIGNGNMVHAPHTGDVVKVASINSSYRVSHYAGAVRVW